MEGHRKQLLLYPCAKSTLPIIRYLLRGQDEYALTAVAPRGWAQGGLDAGHLDHRGEMGVTISNDYAQALSSCDAVWIPALRENMRLETLVSRIEEALEHGLHVRCNHTLPPDQVEALKARAQKVGSFEYLPEYRQSIDPPFSETLKESAIPMIVVGEMLEHIGSLEIMLGLQIRLRREGYNAIAYSSDPNHMLMGHRSIPAFMMNPGVSEQQKIYALNAFMQQEAEALRPDVMLFEMPAPMLPYSRERPNGFGALPYLCSQAFYADCFVLCVQYGTDWDQYHDLLDIMRYRFGFPVDAIALSNAESDSSMPDRGLLLVYHDGETVLAEAIERQASLPAKTIYPFKEEELDKLYQHVMDRLAAE